MMDTKQIKTELQDKGFIHIPYPHSLTAETIKEVCGTILFETLIKENPESNRLLTSNLDVDLHTDHRRAKYIAWQCHSQAAIGGESMLMDGHQILEHASKDILQALQEVSIKSHRLFFDDKPQYPLLSNDHKLLYYASFLCDEPAGAKEKQALAWFKARVRSAERLQLKLSEGDWLIIDNHRMLHGRKGFEKRSNRLLTRYWLSGQAK